MEVQQTNKEISPDIGLALDRKITMLIALTLVSALLSLTYFFKGPLNYIDNIASVANTVVVEKKVSVATEEYRAGHILLKFKPGVSDADKQKELKKIGAEVKKEIKGLEVALLKVPIQAEEALVRGLTNNPNIEFAEVDALTEPTYIPNDPQYASQWAHDAISSAAAWSLASSSNSVTIAIADTGINISHPDLVTNIVLPGYNTVDGSSDISPVHYHGTAIAGIAAATGDNAIGIAGISYNSKILPIRISDRGDGVAYHSDIAEAIVYATDHGARVVNVSYASYYSATVQSAASYLRSKGGVLTMAAGNSATNPGYSSIPDIIVLAALGSKTDRASYSNFGNFIDFAMPGSGILTTTVDGGYSGVSGTSAASPVAAGAIAMMFSANPSLNFNDIERIFIDTATDLGTAGWDPYYGWGVINLEAAVAATLDKNVPVPDNIPPIVSITSPITGATVSGNTNLDVSANDNVAVSRVELLKNGVVIGTDTTSPYSFSWNTLNDTNGSYTIQARAYDSSNNSALSNSVSVTVSNQTDTTPPTVSISYPVAGEVLPTKGNATIVATAADNVGVSQIVIKLDGSVEGSCSNVTTCSTSINLRKISSGQHIITAEAYDAMGNTTVASITVMVEGSGGGDSGNGNGKGKNR